MAQQFTLTLHNGAEVPVDSYVYNMIVKAATGKELDELEEYVEEMDNRQGSKDKELEEAERLVQKQVEENSNYYQDRKLPQDYPGMVSMR